MAREYGGQLATLLSKNALLLRRSYLITLALLVTPVLFVVALHVINLALNKPLEEVLSPPTLSLPRINRGCLVFDSAGGTYGLGHRLQGYPCTALGFAPDGNAEVVEIMRELARRNGLDYATDARQSGHKLSHPEG